MSPLSDRCYALCEAVADMAINFAVAPTVPNDSREATRLCIAWARDFERINFGVRWGEDPGKEYIEAIDAYFAQRYAEWVGLARDVRANDIVKPEVAR